MGEVFLIKGKKVKVEGLGNRECKRELAEKFIKYKEDVERFLKFDEEKTLEEINKKIPCRPEYDYEIEVVNQPSANFTAVCKIAYDISQGFIDSIEKFAENINQGINDVIKHLRDHPPNSMSNQTEWCIPSPDDLSPLLQLLNENLKIAEKEALKYIWKFRVLGFKFSFNIGARRVIYRRIIYHEITHYVVELNLMRKKPELYLDYNLIKFPSYINFISEGFAEFVSRHLTNQFTKIPPSKYDDYNTYLIYEKGWEEIKRLFTSLGRDPKKVLDEVTERILVIIESHKCSKNVQEDI